MTSRTRLIVLFVSTPLLIFVLVGGMLGARAQTGTPTTEQSLKVFEDVVSLIVHNYVEEVNVEKVMDGAMRGLADGLDPDSAYLMPPQVRAVESGEALAEGDVGIDLTRQYYLRVVSTRQDSPAARAGLLPGDFIRAIDGKPTRDLSTYDGLRLLRGAPGTRVSLLVIRGNAADPHVVELVREPSKPQALATKLLSRAVGYLRVPAFGEDTAAAIRQRVAALEKEGATKLVIDLRHSSLGPLEAGLVAAGHFVPKGTTLAVKTMRDQKTPVLNEQTGQPLALPVVILTNYGTAGPAELFAAALSANGRAKLVGENTNGRAGLQKLVKLPQGHGLWLTYATFTTPGGETIHERGLPPTIEVDEPEVEFGKVPDPAAADPILARAIEILGA